MTVSVKQALLGYASLTRERRFFFSERNISELSPTLNHRLWLPSVDLPHRTGTPGLPIHPMSKVSTAAPLRAWLLKPNMSPQRKA